MKVKSRLCAIGALLLPMLLAVPALADHLINTESLAQPGAPIEFRCAVGLQDSAIANFYLGTDFAFRIDGSQPATAVEFRFDLYDAFDTKIGQTTAQKTGYFSPGVTINPNIGKVSLVEGLTGPFEFRTINAWPNVDSAKCSAVAIRWADGSVWRATDSTSSGDAAPEATQQLLEAEGTVCGDRWVHRSAGGTVMNLIGDSCAKQAELWENKGYFAAAARDRARSYVGYMHEKKQAKANDELTYALQDIKKSGVPKNSELYELIASPLLAIDGAAKDSALNDAPAP